MNKYDLTNDIKEDLVNVFYEEKNKTLTFQLDEESIKNAVYTAISKAAKKQNKNIYDFMNKYEKIIDIFLEKEVSDSLDFLCADIIGKTEKINEIKQSIQKDAYSLSNSSNNLENFVENIQKRTAKRCFSSGFKDLDAVLNGGFYPGLYVLGAISGLGKTTFVLQIADHIAEQKKDVIYFSCEMGTEELQAKSISRFSFIKSMEKKQGCTLAQSTMNILSGNFLSKGDAFRNHINESLIEYKTKCAENIYFRSGVGTIGLKDIQSEIEFYLSVYPDRKPFIIIDYLQILGLSPEESKGLTDKQRMDNAVIGLKQLATNYDIPILAISSINRASYTEPISLASLKESGAIEYGSDVVFGLQFKGMDYRDGESETTRATRVRKARKEQEEKAKKQGEFQNIEIKLLKFRNGLKKTVNMDFCPMFNYYRDAQFDDDEDDE